jgi:hypothetical protein
LRADIADTLDSEDFTLDSPCADLSAETGSLSNGFAVSSPTLRRRTRSLTEFEGHITSLVELRVFLMLSRPMSLRLFLTNGRCDWTRVFKERETMWNKRNQLNKIKVCTKKVVFRKRVVERKTTNSNYDQSLRKNRVPATDRPSRIISCVVRHAEKSSSLTPDSIEPITLA